MHARARARTHTCLGKQLRKIRVPEKSYGHHLPQTQGCLSRTAGRSYLGDLTQACDLAGLIIHCEEHGGRLGGMRLKELQGFIQGLWGEAGIRPWPWERGPCSLQVQWVCRTQFSGCPPPPPPLLRAGTGPGAWMGAQHRASPTLGSGWPSTSRSHSSPATAQSNSVPDGGPSGSSLARSHRAHTQPPEGCGEPAGRRRGGDRQQTGTGRRGGPARLALAEAPLSTSRMTRGWLGLLSMSCFVFSNTCMEGSTERGLRSEAQTPTPKQQPAQPLLGESSARPRCRDPPASAHRLC